MLNLKDFLEHCRANARQTREEQRDMLLCSEIFLQAVEQKLEKIPACWLSLIARGYGLKGTKRTQLCEIIEKQNKQVERLKLADKQTLCEFCKRSGCKEQLKYAFKSDMPESIRPCVWVLNGKDIAGWEIERGERSYVVGGEKVTEERTKVLKCPEFTPQYGDLPLTQWRQLHSSEAYSAIQAERERLAKLVGKSKNVRKVNRNGSVYYTAGGQRFNSFSAAMAEML